MGGGRSLNTSSHSYRRDSNEALKHLPNLLGKQLREIEEIPSAVVTPPDGGTIAGTYAASLPLKYAKTCWCQEERVHH